MKHAASHPPVGVVLWRSFRARLELRLRTRLPGKLGRLGRFRTQ
jgi:hypothetical protein